jgi:hypothetical protein
MPTAIKRALIVMVIINSISVKPSELVRQIDCEGAGVDMIMLSCYWVTSNRKLSRYRFFLLCPLE